MLCTICNDDIYEVDELNCSSCNGFLHFGCASLRESAFRKMSKNAKQKWSCSKCKFNIESKPKLHTNITTEDNDAHIITNESFNSLTDSVNFMSKQFDVFSKQLQELILSMKDLREENKILKEQNNDLTNEYNLLLEKNKHFRTKIA